MVHVTSERECDDGEVVYLFELHRLIRDGIEILGAQRGVFLMGVDDAASIGDDATCVVVDWSCVGASEIVRHHSHRGVRTVAYSRSARVGWALHAIESGVDAVIGDRDGVERLFETIEQIRPERFSAVLGIQLSDILIARMRFGAPTAREAEVLELLAQGLGPGAISEELGVSSQTARNHLQRLRTKYSVKATSDLLERVRYLGFLD